MGVLSWLVERRLLDSWTIVHLLLFVPVGLWLSWPGHLRSAASVLLAVLAMGLAWECLESCVEGLWTAVPEATLNRWLSDPLADVAGGALGMCLRKSLRCPT